MRTMSTYEILYRLENFGGALEVLKEDGKLLHSYKFSITHVNKIFDDISGDLFGKTTFIGFLRDYVQDIKDGAVKLFFVWRYFDSSSIEVKIR